MNVAQPIEWTGKGVVMLDQRRLPSEVIRHTYTDYRDVAAAIKDMVIRGAPAIGVAAAMGVALGVERSNARTLDELRAEFPSICQTIAQTRPTAVDLFWAVERMTRRAGIGSALGVIRVAMEQGHKLHVLVPETRPYLQGARLTAWELHEGGVPLTLITDNMVGHFMKTGSVRAVVVGADRIAANGDTANKIGTYQIAVLAHEHGVPFYVAAPVSTFDLTISSGEQIPIEERAAEEVTHFCGVRIAPDVAVANPAFDVTPAHLISAIICERGVARAPYAESLRRLADCAVAVPRAGSAGYAL